MLRGPRSRPCCNLILDKMSVASTVSSDHRQRNKYVLRDEEMNTQRESAIMLTLIVLFKLIILEVDISAATDAIRASHKQAPLTVCTSQRQGIVTGMARSIINTVTR
jgi:hypothetical protein